MKVIWDKFKKRFCHLWHSESGIQIFIPYITLCIRKRSYKSEIELYEQASMRTWNLRGQKGQMTEQRRWACTRTAQWWYKHPEMEGTSLTPARNENYSHVLWASHRYVQITDFLRVLSWCKTVWQTNAAV